MAQLLSDSKYVARRVPGPINYRYAEQEWLHQHQAEYRGAWVALEGSEMVACGTSAKEVLEAARGKGIAHPLIHHIPKEPELPWAGW